MDHYKWCGEIRRLVNGLPEIISYVVSVHDSETLLWDAVEVRAEVNGHDDVNAKDLTITIEVDSTPARIENLDNISQEIVRTITERLLPIGVKAVLRFGLTSARSYLLHSPT
jgi:hypothetical protein